MRKWWESKATAWAELILGLGGGGLLTFLSPQIGIPVSIILILIGIWLLIRAYRHRDNLILDEKKPEKPEASSLEIVKCLVGKIEKRGYFPIEIEVTLRVLSLPIQLATTQLCISDEVIDPISVSPTIPRILEAKIESYIVKYEPTYRQFLKGRTAKFSNEHKAHLLLQLGGEKVKSKEFTLQFVA